jgi:hypothetical protein
MILDKPIWGKNFEENLKWCLECDHDSCWRSDGLHFLWDLERDIIGQFKEKNLDYYGSIYMEFMNFVELDKYEYKDYHQREMKIKLKTVER